MDETSIKAALRDLPLGGLRVFQRIGSTNDEALAWAAQGAGDASLVVADEQTAGRGRSGRRWQTPPGSALAFSVILRPTQLETNAASRLAGLGSMAVADALAELELSPEIKWPNDVLLAGRKVAGVLAESVWIGMRLSACVLGIGINVLMSSAPPADEVTFPATAIEAELGDAPNRLEILRATLAALFQWRHQLPFDEFMAAWQARLAYRGEQVTLHGDGSRVVNGVLKGLDTDGCLLLQTGTQLLRLQAGELALRPSVIE